MIEFKVDKKIISVEDIRALNMELIKKPEISKNKVILIYEADKMTDKAQNSFLKSLEDSIENIFIILMLVIFIILGFFIPSSSGLAVLSIPIMAPLADTVGLPRDVIVSAYQFGQGLISFITPTGLILATLAMVDVTYNKWLKFIMPLMGIIAAFAALLLLVQVHF